MLTERRIYLVTWALILAAYLAGMFLDIQEIDATQYACMGREMLASGNYLELFDGPKPYLDKPPLTFWCTALSYLLLGVSNFSYRLPSVLFSLWATYSTYRLGTLLHGKRTGMISAIILASSQAFFLMNNDVKTDMYLLGPMLFAIWKMLEVARGAKGWQAVLAAVGVGLAMLAKGPIGLVVPVAVTGADILWRRDWKNLFRPAWLLGLPALALLLAPFTWGQYQQYGAEGVAFFYWTQSFGRITGESEWANDASAFFFVHTFAWAFLPWTPAFLVALGRKFWLVIKKPREAVVAPIFGFLFVFAALSFSRFKLPHYIFIVAPFAAIFVAEMIVEMKKLRALVLTQRILAVLLALAGLGLAFWSFPEAALLPKLISAAVLIGTVVWCFWEKDAINSIVFSGAAGIASVNLLLNLVLYPELLRYQSTAEAGKFITSKEIPNERVYAYRISGRALNFYSGAVANPLTEVSLASTTAQAGPFWVYTDSTGLSELRAVGEIEVSTTAEFPHFRVNRITFPFLNPALRPKVLSKRYLLKIEASGG